MALNDALELLDWRFALLERQHGADFLVHVGGYLEAVSRDPLLGIVLGEIHAEAATVRTKFEEHVRDVCSWCVDIRRGLSEAFEPTNDLYEVGYNLRAFDQIAAQRYSSPTVVTRADREDASTAARLLEILFHQTTVAGAPHEPAIAVQARRQTHRVAFRQYVLHSRRCAGHTWQRVLFAVQQMNPRGLIGVPLADVDAHAEELFLQVYDADPAILRGAIWEGGIETRSEFTRALQLIRADIHHLHDELRCRLIGRRSRLALLSRFKQRCEWHDSERMRALAASTVSSKKKERILTDELARFLFDQGLDPLTETSTGRLRPDIVDTDGELYVECKQYGTGGATVGAVRKWAHQVWSTIGRLRGTGFEVREGFLVVFRREGRRLALPRSVHAEGVTLYPLLVDVGRYGGSKEKDSALEIHEVDLKPASARGPT